MTSKTDEFDVRHHDLRAKMQSIMNVFAQPFDPISAAIGIRVTLSMRRAIWRKGSFQQFLPVVARAVAAAERLEEHEAAAATLLVYEAGLREALGDWQAVLSLARRAKPLIHSQKVGAELAVYEGAAAHNLGRYQEAFCILSAGAALAPNAVSRCRVLHKLHRTLKALGQHQEALALLEDITPLAPEADLFFQAELMLDHAALVRRNDPQHALRLAERARVISERAAFSRGVAYADLELGRARMAIGLYPLAADALTSARRAFDATLYGPGRSHVRFEQGRLHMAERRFSMAADLFDEAAAIAYGDGYQAAILRARTYESLVSILSGRLLQAMSAARQAVVLWTSTFVQRKTAWTSLPWPNDA